MRVGTVLGKPAVLRSLSTGSPAGHLPMICTAKRHRLDLAEGSMYSQAHIRLSTAEYPFAREEEFPVQTLPSVAPCDQGQTEKVSLGSLEVALLGKLVENGKGSALSCAQRVYPWEAKGTKCLRRPPRNCNIGTSLRSLLWKQNAETPPLQTPRPL